MQIDEMFSCISCSFAETLSRIQCRHSCGKVASPLLHCRESSVLRWAGLQKKAGAMCMQQRSRSSFIMNLRRSSLKRAYSEELSASWASSLKLSMMSFSYCKRMDTASRGVMSLGISCLSSLKLFSMCFRRISCRNWLCFKQRASIFVFYIYYLCIIIGQIQMQWAYNSYFTHYRK